MYQALYRKYRPLVFSDVVGQAHITDTLRAQVSAGRLSHAYLFTGTRGTGKTTCAKILTRASICLEPVAGNPCNRCAPCLGALDGSLTDIMEIDAASNSGVDNIRALCDETAYTPVSARRRVYIIDEVHMLSAGAFNALLKTLEEPPDYVLFILATTETHKVPATILSRCQRFAFKRLNREDIAARLAFVAQSEKIELMPAAAALLARLSDGALRDALSLLDQCVSAVSGVIDTQEVCQALGLAGDDQMSLLTERIALRDAPGTLKLFREQIQGGLDSASLLGELSQAVRDALMDSIQGEKPSSALGELPPERLLALLGMISDGLARLPRAVQPRIEAELCLLRLCHPEGGLEERVRRLEERMEENRVIVKEPPKPPKQEPPPKPPKQEPPPKPPEAVAAKAQDWKDIRERIAASLPNSLGTFLMLDGVTLRRSEGLWQLITGDALTHSRLSCKAVTDALEREATESTGHTVSVRVVRAEQQENKTSPQLRMLLDQFKE